MIKTIGDDPYLYLPSLGEEIDGNVGPLWVGFSYKCDTGSNGQLFWTTEEDPQWSEAKSVHFKLKPDGEKHSAYVKLPIEGHLQHPAI